MPNTQPKQTPDKEYKGHSYGAPKKKGPLHLERALQFLAIRDYLINW